MTDEMAVRESLFAVGDRVLIVGDTPWATHSGYIIERTGSPDLPWLIGVDGSGYRVMLTDKNLRSAS